MIALKELSGEMDVTDAAKYCAVSPKTIYNAISQGQGPRHIKRFNRLIFIAADLDAWIRANTVVKKAFCR